MESDGDKNLESNIKRESSNIMPSTGHVLQPFRFRLGTVLVDPGVRKFVESKFRIVLYSGVILWIIHFITSR